MPLAATLPCVALEDGEPATKEGWYVAEFSGQRIMAQVVSGNWGMQIRALGRDWFLGSNDLPIRLLARADLDKLHIHPPEADFIRAQIGTIKGMLADRSEEDDPIGHRQFSDRLDELNAKLAQLEGRE